MPKNGSHLSIIVGTLLVTTLIVIGATTLVVRGNSAAPVTASSTTPKQSTSPTVTIPQAQEVFAPFIQTVQPHTTVTWKNDDTVTHMITTTWDQSTFMNPEPFSMIVSAGQTATFTFTKSGIYHYFDNTQATWDTKLNRVSAHKGVPNFPLAMEGIIWVQGPITGLSSSVMNGIPSGNDNFTNEFVAITQGGTVSWHNADTDQHVIALVQGWSSPVNTETISITPIAGTNAMKNGETKTLSFNKPGLYYYYCPNHAAQNTQWHRAQAHPDASIFPIAMEGFVLVI